MRVWTAFLALVCLVPLAAAQRTLRVPTQYQTITAAITAAKNGDTVLVAPGTYPETVDFVGKAILVTSEGGWAVTTIKPPPSLKSGAQFLKGEGRSSILEGFTITKAGDSGVRIVKSSPTVRGCRLLENSAKEYSDGMFPGMGSAWAYGGGFYCEFSTARIEGCEVIDNSASASVDQFGYYTASAGGGGLFATRSTLDVRSCLFLRNYAGAYTLSGGGGAAGGGLHLNRDDSKVVNCAVFENSVGAPGAEGGGVYAPTATRFAHGIFWGNRSWGRPVGRPPVSGGTYVNCIIRENFPTQARFGGKATYCNIEGGWSGEGNFDSDPKYRDQQRHLSHDSPCRNRGTAKISWLPATDHEGDPRISGGKPDVGLDEFFARLWWWGAPHPGHKITLVFDGDPGAEVYWIFSLGAKPTPVAIPGLEGWWALDSNAFGAVRFANLPASGRMSIPFAIAAGFPRVTVHMQALIGKQLTRVSTVTIR